MAYVETLQEIGLSLNEARIYEALLELGESSVSTVATRTSIHRRNVYDAVNRLVDKGLISPIISAKESRYVAVEPEKLLEIVDEKRTKLQNVLPELRKLFLEKKAKEGVFIFKGVEGFSNVARDILRVGGTIYTIGGKKVWLDPLPYNDPKIDSWWREMKKRGMKSLSLIDATVKADYKRGPRISDVEYRFLPKEYSSPAAIDIYGDRVVIYLGALDTINESMVMFFIVSKALAESYKKWFQFMWDRCKPVERKKVKAFDKKGN